MGLFKPGWMSDDYRKAERALQRVTRQAVLCRAALEAPDMRIQRGAIERMEDVSMLMELARDTGPEGIGEQAVVRLLEIEPFASAWCDICMTNGRAAIHNALLQDCLACVSRYGTVILRRKAAGYVTDQALLRWLYENDKDEEVRVNALVRIDDQDYLQAVFDAADSEDLRLCLAVHMRDTAPAAWLARNTEKPYTCVKALRKTGDKALAAEIMGQTLHVAVCEECAGMVNAADITDDWRLAVLALCGPEDVRAQATDRIQDYTVFERIARRKCGERFPVKYERETISRKAVEFAFANEAVQAFKSPESLKAVALNPDMQDKLRVEAVRRITDERTLLALTKRADAREVREEALRRITDAKALFDIVSAHIPKSFTREICARLDELDADWARQLSDAAVKTLTCVIANNEKDEQFDYRHFAAALKSVYRQGRAKAAIEGLHGKAVAHFDYTGKEYRDKWCHQDGDYIYFELLSKPEKHVPAAVPDTNAEDRIPYYEKELRKQLAALDAITSPEKLKAIALDTGMPLQVRAEAIRRIVDEDTLLAVALNLEKADMDMERITDPEKLLMIARDARALNVRKEALGRVTDAEALFEAVISDIPRYCTPEICSRLDELDRGWARQLSDAAVAEMVSIIAENEKDEQFDYRPMAAVLKQVYAMGRFANAIQGLEQKAISHVDAQGREYRDEWCHYDEGYTYFNLTNGV